MTIKVFYSGQSNALGRGTGGPAFSGVSPDVSVWNNVNPIGSNGSAFVTASAAQAAGVFEFTDRNNAGVWLCDRLARTLHEPVTLTLVARGASPISYWSPDEVTYPMLQECIDVWSATDQGPADVFVWQQGEQDVEVTSPAAYRERFSELKENLKTAGVIDDNTLVIVGGMVASTASKSSYNDSALSRCGDAYAPPDGLQNDGVHFSGHSLYNLGVRYYTCCRFLELR